MKIEKLTENKIRIILNIEDLKEKNIDFHSFMSNSFESQDLFFDMLETAEKEIGFVTKDYKLIIEALATSDGNFVLTVTRVIPDTALNKESHKKVNIKRKSITPSKLLSIYTFSNFEEFCDFCTYIHTGPLSSLSKKLKKSTLYLYNSKYYLSLYDLNINLKSFKSFHCLITEFSTYVANSDIFERKLSEYGKVIIETNAINVCTKHFS